MTTTNKYKDKLWDAQITTAGDYTGYMKLKEFMYRNFQNQRSAVNDANEKSDIVAFKKELRKEIEANLRSHFSCNNHDDINYQVANIDFAFDNSEVVRLLYLRGSALKAGNFKKVKELEKELTDKKNDLEIRKQWTTPVGAYITF